MKKYFQIIAWLVIFSACLLGCGKQELDRLPDVERNTNPSYDISEKETENSGEATSIQHITQEICENRYIDADAIIPGKTQYCTYTLKMVDCDPDRLFNIFCPEGHGSYTMEDRGNCVVYDESSGKQLVIYEKGQKAIHFRTYNFKTEKRPIQDLETLMYYRSQGYPQAVPHDLSFIKVEEMEKFGRKVLLQLGISWEPKLLRCVAMSGQEILDFQKELFGDGSSTKYMTPTTLTKATDTCYLQFNFSYDGIPLIGFEEPTVFSYENWGYSPVATATIMFNADGIQTCEVVSPCTIETASDPQPILNIEETIPLLKDKYDLQILPNLHVISDIWMEYIPIKRDEELVLTPYWCFVEINERAIDSPRNLGAAHRFNSITGKDLTYGG